MNWAAASAIIAFIGLLVTALSWVHTSGKLTQKVEDHDNRLDQHEARINDHEKRIGRLEGITAA